MVELAEVVGAEGVAGMIESMRTVYMDLLVELLDSQDCMMVPVSFAWIAEAVMEEHSHNVDHYSFVEYAIVCLAIVALVVHICYYHIQLA